jgi:hypothetical protein
MKKNIKKVYDFDLQASEAFETKTSIFKKRNIRYILIIFIIILHLKILLYASGSSNPGPKGA